MKETPNQRIANSDRLHDYYDILQHIHDDRRIKLKPQSLHITYKKPMVRFNGDEIVELNINHSFIKRLLYKGNERPDICPYNLLKTDIVPEFKTPPSLPQLQGLYAESRILGKSAHEIMLDLPRKGNGDKTIDHQRIDDAINRFKRIHSKTDLMITSSNVQIKIKKPWIDPDSKYKNDSLSVYLMGIVDIISPYHDKEFDVDLEMSVIDFKLTKDRNQCYFNKVKPWLSFTWGCPDEMDHLQGIMYSAMTGYPFMYLVHDYNPKDNTPYYKPIPIKTIASHPDDIEARNRYKEMIQSIRWTIQKILMWNEEGWRKEPCETCNYCPVLSCELKNKARVI